MKSWTRTLNLNDSHTLLDLARSPLPLDEWERRCSLALPHLSVARRRELIRLVRDTFLCVDDSAWVKIGLFSRFYFSQPAFTQLQLVKVQWALSHPLTEIAVRDVVRPRLNDSERAISLSRLSELVAANVHTESAESLRKTRTVLLGALESIGVVHATGTGRNRRISAAAGTPSPAVYAYLVAKGASSRPQRARDNLATQVTLLTEEDERQVLPVALESGLLRRGPTDELLAPKAQKALSRLTGV